MNKNLDCKTTLLVFQFKTQNVKFSTNTSAFQRLLYKMEKVDEVLEIIKLIISL